MSSDATEKLQEVGDVFVIQIGLMLNTNMEKLHVIKKIVQEKFSVKDIHYVFYTSENNIGHSCFNISIAWFAISATSFCDPFPFRSLQK